MLVLDLSRARDLTLGRAELGSVRRPSAPRGVGITGRTIWAHLEALQRIADRHGGTCAVGTPGYEVSVEYVAGVLRDAGYEVEMPTVDVPAFEQEAPTVLERVETNPTAWTVGTDLRAMRFSATGDVRARVTAARGGCGSTDLIGFPEGDVALLQPGPCLRRHQVSRTWDASGLESSHEAITLDRVAHVRIESLMSHVRTRWLRPFRVHLAHPR